MKFKKGDIVYFKSDFIQSIILNINSNYQYTHYRNQPYKIIDEPINGEIYGSIIQNLDNKIFYVGIQMKNYIIHKSEWKQTNREIIINSLLT